MGITKDSMSTVDMDRVSIQWISFQSFQKSGLHMAASRFFVGTWTTFLSVLTRQATLKQIKKNQQKR